MSLHWQAWRNRGANPWVVEVLKVRYRIAFLSFPPLSEEPIPISTNSPSSIKGKALEEAILSLINRGAVELAPLPSPGFYSCVFVVWKTSRSWRPVIDLSALNHFILKTPFKMGRLQAVLLSVRQGDWMVSLDLKDAYLQVSIHPESRKFLRFMAFGKSYQFRALCFGLSTAPQVFTRVMAPVSTTLLQPMTSLRVLLGSLSSLSHLVPGGCLWMRSLQLTLHHSWDQVDDTILVQWDNRCLQDLS